MPARRALLLFALASAACVKYPEPFRPPIQRRPAEITEATRLKHFIAMNDPQAPEHFISGMIPGLNDGTWRWTDKSPTFQFQLPTTKALRLKANIAIPEITFKDTGPVKITVHIGSHLLDTIDFPKHEQRFWEKDVPADWLTTDRPVLVRMEIDKLWKSPADGAQRGFILTSLGFIQ
jgi:hypothetical protein